MNSMNTGGNGDFFEESERRFVTKLKRSHNKLANSVESFECLKYLALHMCCRDEILGSDNENWRDELGEVKSLSRVESERNNEKD